MICTVAEEASYRLRRSNPRVTSAAANLGTTTTIGGFRPGLRSQPTEQAVRVRRESADAPGAPRKRVQGVRGAWRGILAAWAAKAAISRTSMEARGSMPSR